MSSSITFERLPSSFLIVSVFLTRTFEHAIFGPLGQDEVVATNFFRRLELTVDAPVALLDAAGIPR